MARGEAVGGGADCHTRGRACPPELKTGALGEDLGSNILCYFPAGLAVELRRMALVRILVDGYGLLYHASLPHCSGTSNRLLCLRERKK